jgi:hypothetical protein
MSVQRRMIVSVLVAIAAGIPLLSDQMGRCQGPGRPALSAGGSDAVSRSAEPNAGAPTLPAGYQQHVRELRRKLPDDSFSIVPVGPFVVVGDESPAMVRQRAEGTVKWAVDRLKEQFFKKDPAEILDVWLFKDNASYERHTPELFGHEPTTPFGFYSAKDRALVMNIATGGGTLVHEIVHPLMAANFPECPSWFNEGMGSLFEQSAQVDGKIRGLTNWRLEGLQEAIRRRRVGSFQALCSTTEAEFYGDQRGTNYAQARYLCYYLQEHGLLEEYFRQFQANVGRDPSGYRTLKSVLGREDMDAFDEQWKAWVLKLHFP